MTSLQQRSRRMLVALALLGGLALLSGVTAPLLMDEQASTVEADEILIAETDNSGG